jgi:hypothetical protein
MKKSDALKLRVGDVILYGNASRSADWTRTATGRVIRVTPGGQVTVQLLDQQDRHHLWDGDKAGGPIEKVPYHHIAYVESWAPTSAPKALP